MRGGEGGGEDSVLDRYDEEARAHHHAYELAPTAAELRGSHSSVERMGCSFFQMPRKNEAGPQGCEGIGVEDLPFEQCVALDLRQPREIADVSPEHDPFEDAARQPRARRAPASQHVEHFGIRRVPGAEELTEPKHRHPVTTILRRPPPQRSKRSTSSTSRPSEVVRRESGTSIPTRRANSRLAASAFTTGYVSVDVDSFAMNCASPPPISTLLPCCQSSGTVLDFVRRVDDRQNPSLPVTAVLVSSPTMRVPGPASQRITASFQISGICRRPGTRSQETAAQSTSSRELVPGYHVNSK